MLTNEQRAHDLAILMLPYVMKAKLEGTTPEDSKKIKMSIVNEYLAIYDLYLQDLGVKLPQDQSKQA